MKHISPRSKSIHPHIHPRCRLVQSTATLVAAMFLSGVALNRASEIPEYLLTHRRDLSPDLFLDLKMSVDAQHDISLRLQPSIEPLGQQLDTHQMWKLDQIREEMPDQFRTLQRLFPRQIAEYLLRQGIGADSAAKDAGTTEQNAASDIALKMAEQYLTDPLPPGFTEEQIQARRAFVTNAAAKLPPENAGLRAVLESCARRTDPDFGTFEKTNTFLALKKQYSPYKAVSISVIGDTLIIGGKIITERLSADAATAGRTAQQFVTERYWPLTRALAQWRAGQISGDAYAGTIKSFLNDPRLAGFSPEEIHRAYLRIFGRDLKTDINADRISAKEGRAVTYAEMMASSR